MQIDFTHRLSKCMLPFSSSSLLISSLSALTSPTVSLELTGDFTTEMKTEGLLVLSAALFTVHFAKHKKSK